MNTISQTPYSNAFSWMKMFEFRWRFHWTLFKRVHLTIFQHWFKQWLGAVQATSHYLNQWWFVFRRIHASLSSNELSEFYLSTLEQLGVNQMISVICYFLWYQLIKLHYPCGKIKWGSEASARALSVPYHSPLLVQRQVAGWKAAVPEVLTCAACCKS